MEQLTNLNFHLSLQTILSIVFLIMTAVYAIFTFVFYYHWKEYSIDTVVTRNTLILYFAMTLPLLAALGLIAYIGN